MTEFENKLVEKIMEKLDMDKLTDKIAEKAAELIVQKEYPSIPIMPPINPWETSVLYPADDPRSGLVTICGVPSSDALIAELGKE